MDLLNYISQKTDKSVNIKDNNIYPKPYPIVTRKIKDDLKDLKIINIKNPIIKELDNIPNKIVPYKIKDIDEKKYNFLIFGSNDPIFKNKRFNKPIDNKFLYDDASPKELMISNFQTEVGTSNNLQTKLLQVKTGESIDDINNANNFVDNVYKKKIDELMNIDKEEKERISLSKKPELIKEVRKVASEQEFDTNIKENKNIRKQYKADIKPVIIDEKRKKLEKQNEINKQTIAANKIKNVMKNVKAKKDYNEKQKNIKNEVKLTLDDIMNKIEKDNDETPVTENPLNEKESDSKLNDKQKKEQQNQYYENKQAEIKRINDVIKKENENYNLFHSLLFELISLGDGDILDKNNSLRKQINELLKPYDKNIGAAKKKSALMTALHKIEPEIDIIHKRIIKESEDKKLALKDNTARTPKKTKTVTLDDLVKSPSNSDGKKIKIKSRLKYKL